MVGVVTVDPICLKIGWQVIRPHFIEGVKIDVKVDYKHLYSNIQKFSYTVNWSESKLLAEAVL